MKTAILTFLAFCFCSSVAEGLAFCPQTTTTFVPECASIGCPTQAECDSGWQWASPTAPMTTIPVAIVPGPGNAPQIVVCYLGNLSPKCSESVPSISLRTWCETLKALPWPNGVPVQPLEVGVCGSTVPKSVRQGLSRGLKSPDKQVRQASLWILERF
jgi:hypothetical protein